MKPGRLKTKGTKKRDLVEVAMFELAVIERDLDEVILRNRQAIRRTGLVSDVLDPAIARLVEIRSRVRLAKRSMNDAWIDGQNKRWENCHD